MITRLIHYHPEALEGYKVDSSLSLRMTRSETYLPKKSSISSIYF